MSKKNFISLILGTIGGILFALGMCMAMLPEWNAFKPGVIMGVIGAVVLLIMVMVRRKMEGKPVIVKMSAKTVGTVVLGGSWCARVGRWYVHGYGMEHAGAGYHCWTGRHCPAAVPDSVGQGHPLNIRLLGSSENELLPVLYANRRKKNENKTRMAPLWNICVGHNFFGRLEQADVAISKRFQNR